MSNYRNRLILLNQQLCEIDLELLFLEDKIEDVATSGYQRYIKELNDYTLEYLLDKKIQLQQQRNNIIFKIEELGA